MLFIAHTMSRPIGVAIARDMLPPQSNGGPQDPPAEANTGGAGFQTRLFYSQWGSRIRNSKLNELHVVKFCHSHLIIAQFQAVIGILRPAATPQEGGGTTILFNLLVPGLHRPTHPNGGVRFGEASNPGPNTQVRVLKKTKVRDPKENRTVDKTSAKKIHRAHHRSDELVGEDQEPTG